MSALVVMVSLPAAVAEASVSAPVGATVPVEREPLAEAGESALSRDVPVAAAAARSSWRVLLAYAMLSIAIVAVGRQLPE